MTDLAPAVAIPTSEDDRPDTACSCASWLLLRSDEYCPIEETRRTADVRSPLSREYDLPAVMFEVLGRESATCEACQQTVHLPAGGDLVDGDPFVLRELVENVYTVENRVLLCETCANRPTDEWRADVRAKRARERDSPPTWTDYLAYWFSDPTATSLFARRVAMTLTGLAVLLVTVAAVAGIAGSLTADLTTGIAWARTVATTTVAATNALAAFPWVVGALIGVAYSAHAVERVRNDPRGYRTREYQPWMRLSVAGVAAGLGALGFLAIASGVITETALTQLLAAVLWASGAAGVAWYVDLAVRHDLAIGIWRPLRGPWIIAGRVGLLPGLLAITVGVPFPAEFPATTTGVVAAIPAGVALVFVGLRLPHDPPARDAILEALPDRLLSALTDDRRRD